MGLLSGLFLSGGGGGGEGGGCIGSVNRGEYGFLILDATWEFGEQRSPEWV